MNYGYFDDEKREYVITNPRTPTKWINYIGTLAFGGFVDHTGGALICAQDPALNRITKYITQFPASAFNGETLYLRTRTLTPAPLSFSGRGDEGEAEKVLCLFSIRRYIRFSNNALMLNNRINNALLNITIVIVVVIIIPALNGGGSCI